MSSAMDDDGAAARQAADDCELNRWWTVTCSVTNVIHELKNALQVISGNVEMLQAHGPLDPVTDRRLASIAAQAVRAVATIDPLLGYARAASSGSTAVDLRALARTALSFRAVTLSRAGVTTRTASSSADPLFAWVDPVAMLQLVLNLLLDAERDLSGRRDATITVSVEEQGDAAVIVIDGRSDADRPAPRGERSLAARVSAAAMAELARTQTAGLHVETNPRGLSLTLSVPIGAAVSHAADSVPPSR